MEDTFLVTLASKGLGPADLSTYNYAFDIHALLSDNKNGFELSGFLQNLMIRVDRERNVMPVFQMKFSLPPEWIQAIQKDSSKVQVSLAAKILSTNTASNEGANGYDNYIEKVMLTPLLMTKQPINVKDIIDTSAQGQNSNYTHETFEMVLVPTFALRLNKQIVTGAIQNATVTDAILGISSQMGGLKVSMYESANKNIYSQIILTPGNILTNIRYINDNYGIFPYPLSTFITGNTLQIYPLGVKLGPSKKESGSGNINLNLRFPVDPSDQGARTEGSVRYASDQDLSLESILIVDSVSNISLQENRELYSEIFGTDNFYFNTKMNNGGASYIEMPYNSQEDHILKRKFYNNVRSNDMNEVNNETQSRSTTKITYTFSNNVLNFLDMDKVIDLHLDNPNYNGMYNGEYYISQAVFNFTSTNNSKVATLNGAAVLNKVGETVLY